LGENAGWFGELRWLYLASSPLTEDNAFRSQAISVFNRRAVQSEVDKDQKRLLPVVLIAQIDPSPCMAAVENFNRALVRACRVPA